MSDDSIKKLIIVAFVVLILYWGFTSPENADREWLVFLGPILMTYLFKSKGGSKTKKKEAETFEKQKTEQRRGKDTQSSRSAVGIPCLHWSIRVFCNPLGTRQGGG